MSQVLINAYLAQLARLRQVSGSSRETVLREAFKDLLKDWGRQHDLIFVPEYPIETPTRDRRAVDGALLHELRVPFGYWEAKDERDDLDAEIDYKFKRGYPQDNIVFEDTRQAVLIQHREEIMRCDVTDVEALGKLLTLFFAYERPEVADFRHAVEQFKADLPAVLQSLREMIERQHADNAAFRRAAKRFLAHAKEAINPVLTAADVREMLIQHILTEEIFSKVFGEDDFHRQNNVAKELYELEGTFFSGDLKKRTLRGLDAYYAAIKSAAAQISSHHEKQSFLKLIYENFYKVYNAKAADRLGVVYTPNEIVRFMIDGADWLCEQHFGKTLIDRDVDILDPATGTGTFVCELLEHFRGQPAKLRHKYEHELHANEVAILPYYVANLNIEATYAAITGEYREFKSLCFVDTLDNVGLHTQAIGTTADLFAGVSDENVARIKRQNARRISVVIGNPPYNANQANENDNNKNREYPSIDAQIKRTYIAESTAQKTKLYDMYARFFRWASDRLDANGILAFVTNRSFLESRTFDGFRKTVAEEFSEIRIVDLGGDVRANPKLSGSKHNVFGIQTGVAISFMVKKTSRAKDHRCRIYYSRRPELETAEEKLAFIHQSRLATLAAEEVRPDAKGNWLNLTHNDFDGLLPVASKATKQAKRETDVRALFRTFSLGVVTARDEWVYDSSKDRLVSKIATLIDTYNSDVQKFARLKNLSTLGEKLSSSIKWSRAVKRDLIAKTRYRFDESNIVRAAYRPFIDEWLYYDPKLNEMQNLTPRLFGQRGDVPNRVITFTDAGSQKPFMVLATDRVFDYHFVGAAAAAVALPEVQLDEDGTRHDNITDWGLKQFTQHYKAGPGTRLPAPTKEGVFHYVYAVLHDPRYRETYAQNLKREFPRVPLIGALRADFWRWADWGRALMALHIGYEQAAPFALTRTDTPDTKARAGAGERYAPKCVLRAEPEAGRIVVDSETVLTGIPPSAWAYRLGNRSAIDWVLDQHKERKPKDPTIREHFDTYRFADHKERVIELLARVVAVSLETLRLVGEIEAEPR